MLFFMALQLIFVDPIVGESSSFVHDLGQNKPAFEQDKNQLQDELGIRSWQVWIQKGPGSSRYSIQQIECQEPERLLERFSSAVSRKNSYACWLSEVFLRALSSECYLMNPASTIEEVLDLDIDPGYPGAGFEFCYTLPLLPGKREDQVEYCRAAMNEKQEQTIAACKAFRMVDMKKWIQQSPGGDYVLYHEHLSLPVQEARELFLSFSNDPKALQATKTLREQSG
ncbi:MAG: hypothetical protein JSR46_07375, partial [Verrucomicrobia bacterium]|nr:hypothetical protein [Verrucomicrobiota bacterium]